MGVKYDIIKVKNILEYSKDNGINLLKSNFDDFVNGCDALIKRKDAWRSIKKW